MLVQTFVTVVFPISLWHTGDVFQFNTMLFSNLTSVNEGRGMRALSTLKFFTSHAPCISCAPSDTVAFDATQHVRTERYRGHALVAETITGNFSLFNDSSLSSTEALATLVLGPVDSTEALAYFEKYTDEHLRLDELFMSHGKLSLSFPSQIPNSLQGTAAGRTSLALDPELLASCPLLGLFTSISQKNIECATKKDWDVQSQHARVGSSVYYVHQVFGIDDTEADDLAWVSSNVFGPSDPRQDSAHIPRSNCGLQAVCYARRCAAQVLRRHLLDLARLPVAQRRAHRPRRQDSHQPRVVHCAVRHEWHNLFVIFN